MMVDGLTDDSVLGGFEVGTDEFDQLVNDVQQAGTTLLRD